MQNGWLDCGECVAGLCRMCVWIVKDVWLDWGEGGGGVCGCGCGRGWVDDKVVWD